jgi:DNA primase
MALYSDEIIEEIRISNDIVDVVREYVQLKKTGKNYMGLCPFHKEKTPSFSVEPSKQLFYCFGCAKGGNVVNFIQLIENLSFRESIEFLANRAGIQLPGDESEEEQKRRKIRDELININTEAARFFYSQIFIPENTIARLYLQKRGIGNKILNRFGIGYCPETDDSLFQYLKRKGFSEGSICLSGLVSHGKSGVYYDRFKGRIMFPIFDIKGKVIAFGGRVINQEGPKYMNSPETPVYHKGNVLYAMNFARQSDKKRIFVVEGYMDVISLHQSGIINSVGTLGTALTEEQGRILKKYAEEVIISYDSDAAGQAAAMRSLDILNRLGCNVKVLEIPKGKDPDEYIRSKGKEEFEKIAENSVTLLEYKAKKLKMEIDTSTA